MQKGMPLRLTKIILGLFFIFSATTKLFPLELFELKLIHDGFANWQTARLVSTSIISFEIILGLSFIINWTGRRTLYVISISFMLLMTGILIRQLLNGDNSDCGCFGGVLSLTPLQSLYKNIALLIVMIILAIVDRKDNRARITSLAVPLAFVLTIVLINVSYPESTFQKNDKSAYVGQDASFESFKKFERGNPDLTRGEHLVLFLSAGCDHCRELLMRLTILEKEFDLPKPALFIWGSDEKVKSMFKITPVEYDYAILDVNEFFSFREKGFPKVYYLVNGKIKQEWNYQTFTKTGISDFFEKNLR